MKIRAVSCSGGKDSTAAILLAIERHPLEEIRGVYADTGNEHEATYEYVTEYLPKATGVKIQIVKADFTEDIARTRARLERFAAGEPDPRGKYRWTPERAKAALEVLHPTGVPFLDLCLAKGMFPTRSRQFCTERLKMWPMMEWTTNILDEGHEVESWQGVRWDESPRRRGLPERDDRGGGYTIYRPILSWTSQNSIDYVVSKGIRVNDLYMQGMNRVGCMPCIQLNKAELAQIAKRFPHHIARIARWEELVNVANKTGRASFLYSGDEDGQGIFSRVEWAKTDHGGKQYLLEAMEEPSACASVYGLCE